MDLLPWRRSRCSRIRVTLGDGARTTLHVASYDRDAVKPRVVVLEQPMPLVRWCSAQDVRGAIVGGFFVRPDCVPLGQLQLAGKVRPSVAFDAPWGEVRACVQIDEGVLRIARRDRLGVALRGDLLQAGPLLVAGGRRVLVDGEDHEGFSEAAHQFDSDITRGRFPRAALAVAGKRLLAVACDGRARHDAGMALGELADALVKLGATDALNLDGGGSASLVQGGRLRNRPREEHGADLLDGRPIVTAIVFDAC
ncbi:MAG: phosphodiester glycosidase family protein [Solirubrobacteraceae bacterium]